MDRPPGNLRDLDEASLRSFAVQEHNDELVEATFTFEGGGKAWTCSRRRPCLDAREDAQQGIVMPEQHVCVLPVVEKSFSNARRSLIFFGINDFYQQRVLCQGYATQLANVERTAVVLEMVHSVCDYKV